MSAREPESMLFELDYWKAVLEDCLALNDGIKTATDRCLDAVAVQIDLTVLAAVGAVTDQGIVARLGDTTANTLDALKAVQEPLERLIALADGRLHAMRQEMDA